ncbi:hypothetical protein C444_13742 [Haloarcula japonica DSM 6131]|uniref:Uncharacterized protein n=1 Tax=Haloarcula japonica (strain ATCC 49778 / DSM 6131 / JCM 7785 / NBRC 101032 / NCIMB 13157 / TR-1) TaxID=1227453 RepID=M0L8H4_HALJT|nr:hypothetical protein C444_13742 [Haloarcula japonica DSM 6131]
MTVSARKQNESHGAYYRTDVPDVDPAGGRTASWTAVTPGSN